MKRVEQIAKKIAMTIPTEFEQALNANAAARQAFERLPPSHRKEYVEWIASAKKADTRMRRAEQAVEMLLKKS